MVKKKKRGFYTPQKEKKADVFFFLFNSFYKKTVMS